MKHEDREILFRRALQALNQGLLTEAANMFVTLADDCDHDARFLSYRGLLLAIRGYAFEPFHEALSPRGRANLESGARRSDQTATTESSRTPTSSSVS